MIRTYFRGGRFYIVTNLRILNEAGLAAGTRSIDLEAARIVYDEVWTGDKWSMAGIPGLEFASGDDAQTYIDENHGRLEMAL